VDYLAGGGEMAALVRSKDWSRTTLGPVEQWPQSLRTTISLCLASNFPINIIWGPDHAQIYNDGYRVVCGDAHPAALGQGYDVTWASAWPAVGEPFARALAGETSFLENQRMFLTRNGYLEETFFTFSLSPIRDESGGIGGLFHPVTETTPVMLAERRTRAIRDLTAVLGGATRQSQLAALTIQVLANFDFDLPFSLFYELDPLAGIYRLCSQHGLDPGSAVSPAMTDPTALTPWPIRQAAHEARIIECRDVNELFGDLPCGPYDEAPNRTFVLPVCLPGVDVPPVVLVLGASSRLPIDDAYRGFYDLLLAALSAGLARVRALEDEHRRAEALAELDRAKTAFFSNVSHEFRTPLTLLLGPVEDALEDAQALAPQQRERLEVVHRNALRLMRLVNALLDFSRIEAGRARAYFQPTDLAVATAELVSNFESACTRAGLTLNVDCRALSRPAHVDRDMWEKIVLNLVSNAFKFTLSGGITVSLQEHDGAVELAVRDTGVGIPPAELSRVFERFHRIEGQCSRTHEGSGIGLSLVQELVKLHHGTVEVESNETLGTVFRVTIPFEPLGSPHEDPKHAALPSTTLPARAFVEEALRWLPDEPGEPLDDAPLVADQAPRRSKPRVVIADDNADMRAYLRRILENGGYQVEAVEDGITALAAVRRQPPPDLLLSDVMMPGLDGFALLRAIRSDPALQRTPVILLSARAGEEAKVEGLAAGADDYLLKPFSGRELVARIDGTIRLDRQRREATEREQDLQMHLASARSQATLREREHQLELALNAGRLGSWQLDLTNGAFFASEICRATLGWAPSEQYSYRRLLASVFPADRVMRRQRVAEAIRSGSDLELECRFVRPEGDIGWILVRGRASYAGDGTPIGMAGVSLDITERKRGEERQRALLDELNHRVKNTLAVVQSIARQTRQNAKGTASFDDAFASRIDALAQAHDLLTRTAWDGAMLSDVVIQALAPHSHPAGGPLRVAISGPPIRLRPNAAVTLNMAFHELATNAAKYGALSSVGGRVDVTWSVDRSDCPAVTDIVWTERGGPCVGPQAPEGFGSRLIKTGLPRELGGSVSMDFTPNGLICRMRLTDLSKMAVLE
jgi:signal transduction histidine kinase/DNA-binding response OmpR family regulator